jgi:hypothetical protein
MISIYSKTAIGKFLFRSSMIAFLPLLMVTLRYHCCDQSITGLGLDQSFLTFFAATQRDRATAFRAFQLALVSFLSAFALRVKLLMKPHKNEILAKSALVGCFLVGCGFMGWRLLRMSLLAEALIFN